MSCIAFTFLEEKILTTKDKFYPHQNVELRCTHPNSVAGRIKWRVNDKDPAENSAKYTITNDGSTLIVNDASESDTGELHDLSLSVRKVLYCMTKRLCVDSADRTLKVCTIL